MNSTRSSAHANACSDRENLCIELFFFILTNEKRAITNRSILIPIETNEERSKKKTQKRSADVVVTNQYSAHCAVYRLPIMYSGTTIIACLKAKKKCKFTYEHVRTTSNSK